MTLISAAIIATLLVVMAAAAAAPSPAPPVIGLPGCNTTCGDVSVPYPFGIQPGCFREGFNLTCDSSSGGLLLGDGSLRVVNIYPRNSTVRVLRNGSMVKGADDDNITSSSDGLNITLFAPIFAGGHYRVSSSNELVLFGCDVLATLVAGMVRFTKDSSPRSVRCVSLCFRGRSWYGAEHYCSGEGCCQTSFSGFGGTDWHHLPTELQVRRLESRNNKDSSGVKDYSHVSVFLAETGWLDRWGKQRVSMDSTEPYTDIPLILRWDLTQGLALPESDKNDPYDKGCPRDVANICKSNNSLCTRDDEVYQCTCEEGYDGNPYVDGGCQDVDECKNPQDNGCLGDCTNTEGSFECRCPSGTFGDATVGGGCLHTATPSSPDASQLAAGMPPARIGLPDCDTTCGDVQVPYPFGFGPSRCYSPGFQLTCDANHKPPRLLLGGGNSAFQVVGIFLNDSTVRVIHATTFDVTNATYRPLYFGYDKEVGVHFPDIIGGHYMLSTRNEFILTGCNVEAALLGPGDDNVISSCVSNCTGGDNEYCSGRDGCCHAHIPPGSKPKRVKFRQLDNNPNISPPSPLPPLAFVAEEGQIDQWYMLFNRSTAYYLVRNESWKSDTTAVRRYMASRVPLVLRWMVKQNESPAAQSDCQRENGSYICHCKEGFYGNPYITGGCQDIDECKIPSIRDACFGECENLDGSYKCRCPRATRGDPSKLGGCIKILTGLQIGLIAASGPTLLLLFLGVNFTLRKIRQRRIKLQRQKYFKQNRGQLLQQLVSQRADIAERMVIPLQELEKATNNFDQSRKLGGGGHGTVYKGILSDLHVVAIKKSKVVIQREIDEFINEVAILSQINHKNVVKLLGCCLETQVPLLVYEFISNGTLHYHLHKEDLTGSLPWRDRLRIAGETAKAIAYLHSSVSTPIIHRDIKSANILLDDAMTAKVSDFGASRYIPIDQNEATTTAVQGTIGYLDPMYYYTRRMTEMSDIYSFGVVLIELLTRKIPTSYKSQEGSGLVAQFNALLSEENLAQILDPQVLTEGGNEVEGVAALAASCTKYRGEERPTMRQVEMALEAFQTTRHPVLDNVVVRSSKGNIAGIHLLTRRRTDTDEGTRQYSLEEEFLLSASFPR